MKLAGTSMPFCTSGQFILNSIYFENHSFQHVYKGSSEIPTNILCGAVIFLERRELEKNNIY